MNEGKETADLALLIAKEAFGNAIEQVEARSRSVLSILVFVPSFRKENGLSLRKIL